MKITPTQEQVDIINLVPKINRLKIEARAGSGKSSTLVLISEVNPVKSLYLTYNKAMGEEAKGKFPAWVDVRTTHSLAYREVGHNYQHKLTRPYGAYKNVLGTGGEIARAFRLAPFMVNSERVITSAAIGHAIKSTVNNFEFSGHKHLQDIHVSLAEAKPYLKLREFKVKEYKQRILKWAKKLWEKRIDIYDETLINHDSYLKMYQLSNPDLSGYEIIYADEFHDSNPCLLEIIKNQDTKIIVVGDFAQAIYQWRGSVNAMEVLDWETMQLTKSFRFGQDIADLAHNLVLDKSMKPFMQIQGYEKKHTEVLDALPSNITEGVCYIYRTNTALLEKALELLEQGKRVAIHVDVSDFVAKVNSVVALKEGNTKKVKHPDILIYNTWADLLEEASFSKGELQRIVKIVSSGEHTRVLALLDGYRPVKNPDVMLITAHKSKGLEFNVVVIGDDFEPLCKNEQTGKIEFVNVAERNLLYVACTRAIELLVISDSVKEVLDLNGLWSDNTPLEEDFDVFSEFSIGSATIQKYEHGSHFDLEKEVRLQTNALGWDSGTEISNLAEWAVDSAPDDEDSWKNIYMEPTGTHGG